MKYKFYSCPCNEWHYLYLLLNIWLQFHSSNPEIFQHRVSKPPLFPPQLPLWRDYPYKNKPILWCVHHLFHFHGRSFDGSLKSKAVWGGETTAPKVRRPWKFKVTLTFCLLEGFKIHSAFILIDIYEDLRMLCTFVLADVCSGLRWHPTFVLISLFGGSRWHTTFVCLDISKFGDVVYLCFYKPMCEI